ncbi:phage holin family protein [Sporolactobacillus terrae]|uniref:phage holin family protein n=1 Tax=Sporolactobacillus terrae TaxID=269673 RepID=UPI00048C1C44|nr:phage holin family protein [Sporolactobacillus terrae]
MQHNTDTLWTALLGGAYSAAAFLLGGLDNLIIAFGVMMGTDYISGVMAAYYMRTVSSYVAYRGLMKKSGMIMAVVVAHMLDMASGSGTFMRNAMLMFLIGTEGISFTENLGHMGVPLPQKISEAFTQLRGENKKGEKKQ